MAFRRKVYESIATNDGKESDDQMGIKEEEEHDEKDWEYEEEPPLIFVGDNTPEVEAKVENDPGNGNGDEADDIIIVALKKHKNTDNVFEQPELNFEAHKTSEIDPDPVDESTVDEPADDKPTDDEPTNSATANGKDFVLVFNIYLPSVKIYKGSSFQRRLI